MGITKGGRQVRTLEEWGEWAGPKHKRQWAVDRSAMELARCWLAVQCPNFPDEVGALLATHASFGAADSWEAEPEVPLAFDEFSGPRNSDLVVDVRDRHGKYVLAIEAKADEPFSETVADALAAAIERKLENPGSNGLARIEQLAGGLLGPRRKGEPPLGTLRYQLLTATAGALRAGTDRGGGRVVLLVQEFVTRRTKDMKHEANATDLDRFVARLSHGKVSRVEPAVLHGPFDPVTPLLAAGPPLYIAKTTRRLRPSVN